MEREARSTLRQLCLEMRHVLEGWYDESGKPRAGDIAQRLNALGVWSNRDSMPLETMTHLEGPDRDGRATADSYIAYRKGAGVPREYAFAELVAQTSSSWANRLLALRCLEARGLLIDEVVTQKEAYGGRSLVHSRFVKQHPEQCAGPDEGLFAVLSQAFAEQAELLPDVFDPEAPAIRLRPSVAALKHCIGLLSAAGDEIFEAPDALGWAYQYWNAEEKDRVFGRLSSEKGYKIAGRDIVAATQLYTEPYIVRFLLENSVGAWWAQRHPESRLQESWERFAALADRVASGPESVADLRILDPACGSGHFLVEAFDLLFPMYEAEGKLHDDTEIAASILNRNLYGCDIDGRAVQLARTALLMRAAERGPGLKAADLAAFHEHIVALDVRLPAGREHLERFLARHPDDKPLEDAIAKVLRGLLHADELGTLLQTEEPIEAELRRLEAVGEQWRSSDRQEVLFEHMKTPVQGRLPLNEGSYEAWRRSVVERLRAHFHAEARRADPLEQFFGREAERALLVFDLLARRYHVVITNPPYMGSKNMGPVLQRYVKDHYPEGRRDLYAAFILRGLELLEEGGRLAMVTQQSWMFLRSYADLRALDEEKLKKAGHDAFKGLLRDTTIETLAHLGEHAFEDAAAAGAFVVLFVLAKAEPAADHRITALRLIGPKSADEKDRLLREALAADRAQGSAGAADLTPSVALRTTGDRNKGGH